MIWLLLPSYLTFNAIIFYFYGCQVLSYYTIFILYIIYKLRVQKQPEYFYEFTKKMGQTTQKAQNSIKNCEICKQLKPARYYHCRNCNKCTYRMNHHCNWIGICIGLYNLKVYLSLLFHLMLLIILSCILTSYLTIKPYIQKYISIINPDETGGLYWATLLLIDLYILSESYRLWKGCWQGLQCNQTLIQSYKQVYGKKQSIQQAIKEITNGKQSWLSCLYPSFIRIQQNSNFFDIFEQVRYQFPQKKQEKVYDDDYFDQYQQIEGMLPPKQD